MLDNHSTVNGPCAVDPHEIDRCAEAFQTALNRGQRPPLEDFLPVGYAAAMVLVELVHVELEFRLKKGEAARVEEYLARYPQLADDPAIVADLAVMEYMLRLRREPSLDREAFLRRFAARRDTLAARLAEASSGPATIRNLGDSRSQTYDITLPSPPASGTGSAGDFPRVPGYEIVAEVGRGAMGTVYEARQISLNRIVALKMLHASRRSDAERRARFRIEVETIALLQHPNIVQVYDVGEHEGRPFFTMEFLGGGSLEECCQGKPQAPKAAAELVETLARAMHAVHAKGIVHRDLKPSNIVRTTDGRPKISDFGLARHESSDLTATGDVLGTPSYMAPEQAAGKVHEVGPAADVYALGAILYELLTSRPPFRGVTVMDVVRQVQDSDPLPPRRLEGRTPRDLETICLKCLRKEPNRRYADAGALADDLRRFRNGESIRARPQTRSERVAHWIYRHPAAAALLAAVVLAMLAVPLALLGHNLRLQEALLSEQTEREHARWAEDQARVNEAEARVAHFAADLQLAHTLFKSGDVFQLPSLLDPHRPTDDKADDLREFAWCYLRQYGQTARPALPAHDGPVYLLAYTPDGRSLVTAGGANHKQTLKVWDLQVGRPSFQQPLSWSLSHDQIDQTAFAPQAALVAAITKGEIVLGWGLDSPQPRFRMKQSDEAFHLALSPDGRRLAVSGPRSTALWDCAAARQERTLATPPEARLAFSPDGETLLAASNHASFRGVQWWDVSGAARGQVHVPQGVRSAFYSPRSTFVLLIDGAGNGAIWDAKQRIPLHWSWRIGPAASLAISADERTLATGSESGEVRLWDIAEGEARARYRWQPNAIVRLAFSPDNRTLAAANAEGQVQQIDAAVRHVPTRLQAAAMNGRVLAWSPDGEMVAAAARGGAAYLFDRRTGTTRAVLRCPVQDVRCLAFAPDGRTLAVVCLEEPFVRLWDIAEGRWRTSTASHPSPVTAIAFSPDGRWLASLAGDTVCFWDPATAAPRGSLAAGPNTRAMAFAPDGSSLLTAGSTLQVWDVGEDEQAIRKAASAVPAGAMAVCLAVTRDGRLVASGGEDGSVRLWKRAADRTLTPDKAALLRPAGGGAVSILGFAPDAKTLLIGQGGGLELWDLASRSLRDALNDPIASAAFSPKENTFATVGGGEEVVRLWDPADWRVTRPMGQQLEPVKSLAYSADGRTLMTASNGPHRTLRHHQLKMTFDTAHWRCLSESLRFWDAKTGREELPVVSTQQLIALPSVLTRSADGSLLAAGAEDGSIHVCDWPRKQWRSRLFVSEKARLYAEGFEWTRRQFTHSSPNFLHHSEGVAALAFSPDGGRLAVAGNRGSFRVWRTEDDNECCHWQGDANGSSWLAFTPDGDGVVGSRGGQVCIWDAHTGALRTTLGDETDSPVLCGVFAPTGDVLAFGSKDGLIRLWNVGNGDMKRLPGGQQDRVTALAFTPDGRTLASAGWDRTVRLWNMRACREVAALEGHNGRINALAFSPDGRVLASGGEVGDAQGEVLFWRRPPR
jgi:WD40 repeat protein/tRNA A-37 threonylcarbamoyl transferase component Bud32